METVRLMEGFARIPHSHKRHYFRDGVSLCRPRYHLDFAKIEDTDIYLSTNCGECSRILYRERHPNDVNPTPRKHKQRYTVEINAWPAEEGESISDTIEVDALSLDQAIRKAGMTLVQRIRKSGKETDA